MMDSACRLRPPQPLLDQLIQAQFMNRMKLAGDISKEEGNTDSGDLLSKPLSLTVIKGVVSQLTAPKTRDEMAANLIEMITSAFVLHTVVHEGRQVKLACPPQLSPCSRAHSRATTKVVRVRGLISTSYSCRALTVGSIICA